MLRHTAASLRAPAVASAAACLSALRPAHASCLSLRALPLSCALPASHSQRGFATKAPAGGNKGSGKGGKGKDAKDAKDKDAAKKKKKKVGKASGGGGGGAAAKGADVSGLEALLEQHLSQPVAPDTRTPAELALDHEYGLEYSRRMMAEHKARQKIEHEFLRARWVAVNALPNALRKQALIEDMAPWPKHFQPIPWTPEEYVKRFGGSGTAAAANAASAASAAPQKQGAGGAQTKKKL